MRSICGMRTTVKLDKGASHVVSYTCSIGHMGQDALPSRKEGV